MPYTEALEENTIRVVPVAAMASSTLSMPSTFSR